MYIVPRRIREVRQKEFAYRGEIDENGLFDGLGEFTLKTGNMKVNFHMEKYLEKV